MKTLIELKQSKDSVKFIQSIDVNAIKREYGLFVYTNGNVLEIVIKGNHYISYSTIVDKLFIENEDDIIMTIPNDILFRVISKDGD